jgi:hypothetical protein
MSTRSSQPRSTGSTRNVHIIVTAGPTHEPIDPVRYLANRSSGKQGFAIAAALAAKGAQVTLIAGPVTLATPPGITRVDVETARDMAAAVEAALPADAAILVAAVADWRVESAGQKIKKDGSGTPPVLHLVENPDILATLARSPQRPRLLIGFAAETENVIANAQAKLARKGCDWIVANDVSGDVMGGAANTVHVVTADGVESWARMAKDAVAERLAERVLEDFGVSAADFLRVKPLSRLADIRSKRVSLPATRGVYGLFFLAAPGLTPLEGCYNRDGMALLYIGTAGADLRKHGTLKSRLGVNHLGGNERRSTVCQTLAALLPEIVGAPIARTERGGLKLHTSESGAKRLRTWMDDNISACWIEVPRPADLEKMLVRKYAPPLNIDFNAHPFGPTLIALRDQRRKEVA